MRSKGRSVVNRLRSLCDYLRRVSVFVYMWLFLEPCVRRNPQSLLSKVSDRARCPGCGIIARHKIEFAPRYEKVFHTCGRCSAVWPEEPIIPGDQWRIVAVREEPKESRSLKV